MEIKDHWLTSPVKNAIKSPNKSGSLVNPTGIVLHYTASGGSALSDAQYLSKAVAKASAHVVVGRTGIDDVHQIVPFNQRAWHAGVSSWRGRSNCNDYMFGIEIDNYGYIIQTMDGKFHPGANPGAVIDPSLVYEGKHKNSNSQYKYWEVYPQAQIDLVIELCNLLIKSYPTVKEIVGHDDIAPGRKLDPGPALPWNYILSNTLGRITSSARAGRVNARDGLNLRGGPGTNYGIIIEIPYGTFVEIVYDNPGDWAQVRLVDSAGNVREGYVAARYLDLP